VLGVRPHLKPWVPSTLMLEIWTLEVPVTMEMASSPAEGAQAQGGQAAHSRTGSGESPLAVKTVPEKPGYGQFLDWGLTWLQ